MKCECMTYTEKFYIKFGLERIVRDKKEIIVRLREEGEVDLAETMEQDNEASFDRINSILKQLDKVQLCE